MLEYARKLLHTVKSPALAKIWEASKGERLRILLLSVFYAAAALLSLAFTLTMKELVDAAVTGNVTDVKKYAFILAGVILIILASGYFRRMLQIRIRTNLLKGMRTDAMHRLLRKQYADLKVYHSGELVNRIFSDVNIVADGILNIAPPLLYLSVQLVGAVIILGRLNSGFMLILLAAGVFGAFGSFAFRHKMKAFHKETQSAEDKYHARVQETLENLKIIKASGTERRMEGTVSDYQSVLTHAQIRRGRFTSVMSVGMGLVFRGSWFYALMWGCSGIYHGHLTYGTLTAILQLVGQIQSPFEELISTLATAYGAVSSAERLMELYDLQDDGQVAESSTVCRDFSQIELKNITFSYKDGESVLENVSLTFHKGDTVAIMGASGCGKSTLFLLMLGIYSPNDGSLQTITENGDIVPVNRSLFAYVPQGNALFSGTLRENIAMFSKREMSDEEIWQAAGIACIDDFIREQREGLNTLIGEHGLGLSEGQAQRIAIARAVATDAPILLLDEATSALDEQTEAAVLRNISELQGKTCLIVTHRRAALSICSERISIENGRIG